MTRGSSQLEDAINKVVAELREGLRHGFFEYKLVGEIGKGGQRQLILEAGKKYKFTIPAEAVERSGLAVTATPETGARDRNI